MSYLVTGAAGFIGFHVCYTLLTRGETVIGVDVVNDYYDQSLKEARLAILAKFTGFSLYRCDIAAHQDMEDIASRHPEIERVIHLAAQPGVRYSLINPYAYTHSNVSGQVVMLETARRLRNCKHFVYASSSSVYGANKKLPFSESDRVDNPVSLYAATKKSAELISHTYSHIYGLPTTGLRFFTVYGPWGRPDMSAFLFTKSILEQRPITVFNNGNMKRDFTYVDDIVNGVILVADSNPIRDPLPYKLYNIGNHQPESLMRFIAVLEDAIGVKAKIDFQPLPPGDVLETYADISQIQSDFGFQPSTDIDQGLRRFVEWYRAFYKV